MFWKKFWCISDGILGIIFHVGAAIYLILWISSEIGTIENRALHGEFLGSFALGCIFMSRARHEWPEE